MNYKPKSVDRCGTGCVIGIHRTKPIAVVVPLRCKSWYCERCRTPKAWRTIQQIVSGSPERFITLTCNPAKAGTKAKALSIMKKGFTKLIAEIKKEFKTIEYAMFWETTKKGWPHIHVAQRGTYIPHSWLKATWSRLTGAYIVHITKVTSERGAAFYMAKYLTKDQSPTLKLLGSSRIVQYSKNYRRANPDQSLEFNPRLFAWFPTGYDRETAINKFKMAGHEVWGGEAEKPITWITLDPTIKIPTRPEISWDQWQAFLGGRKGYDQPDCQLKAEIAEAIPYASPRTLFDKN